ncbi:CDP-alcohol phosphatidyltransferase family protein [Microbacterium sp. NIBRBAC000506063]|uniref:CDP-alcohol phosphatidyltransferase family protein n=1 Tax=Microbacterium sp. NIBRBAC000506063 TaxID=2734618 RepID=UPI001BB6D257|nr:CDP-alcohol phosphatidyltransferase family protein [Microbacterium sp. NIBRBAC000506063]QTV80189.1 CDP-alcohol phosphatidyltransferase family protein [Microbacterium sp. NIBRBAC000506063]
MAVTAATVGATPNQVTAVSALLGIAGILTLALVPLWWAGIVAAALLLLGYVFDSADGQLARLQGGGGPAGEWLDHVVDAARAPLVHIGVAVFLVRSDQPLWLAVTALLFSALVSSWFLSQQLAEKLLPKSSEAPTHAPGIGVLDSLVKQPQDVSTTYFVIALIGIPFSSPSPTLRSSRSMCSRSPSHSGASTGC